MTYDEWAARWPQAAAELEAVTAAGVRTGTEPDDEGLVTEADAQDAARLCIAHQGAYSWRNNVGAVPAKCRECGARRQPVRYGLANESQKQNEVIKSADLILAIPRVITPSMVGTTMAQFGSVEVKPPGWSFTGRGREAGQMAWATLIKRIGGFATFSTGDVRL